jgi:hypothetical protein
MALRPVGQGRRAQRRRWPLRGCPLGQRYWLRRRRQGLHQKMSVRTTTAAIRHTTAVTSNISAMYFRISCLTCACVPSCRYGGTLQAGLQNLYNLTPAQLTAAMSALSGEAATDSEKGLARFVRRFHQRDPVGVRAGTAGDERAILRGPEGCRCILAACRRNSLRKGAEPRSRCKST